MPRLVTLLLELNVIYVDKSDVAVDFVLHSIASQLCFLRNTSFFLLFAFRSKTSSPEIIINLVIINLTVEKQLAKHGFGSPVVCFGDRKLMHLIKGDKSHSTHIYVNHAD